MTYRSLQSCVADLEKTGQLVRISCELDPVLEIAAVQRRAFLRNSPALLFTHVKGCAFPMLGNLFGTMERTRYIFRHTLQRIEQLFALKADPWQALRHPLRTATLLPALHHSMPKTVRAGSALACRTSISALPHFVSWPEDGGAYVTLPLVYTEDPDKSGYAHSNLGMYRVQLTGGTYRHNEEVGMHYQIHRGIGQHHASALEKNARLPVTIWVGGPPALTLAAVMPMPEGVPELPFAGILAGHRIPLIRAQNGLVVPAEADFCIHGYLTDAVKPEGPFGDHLGYYSLCHDFPVLQVSGVYHKPNAIWPFTSVGRPPQEDSIFGAFIHSLTKDLVPTVFQGIKEVHAVDVAGVHPLLLAIGSERYTPYEQPRKARALLTQGLHLFGDTQTCLAKYIMIAAKEDDQTLSTTSFDDFFHHILKRTDFTKDLHILPRMTVDTLDYTGHALHEGSKLLWAAAGPVRRQLGASLPEGVHLPQGFGSLLLFRPGILVCNGQPHTKTRNSPDAAVEELAAYLAEQEEILRAYPLLVIADNSHETCASWENFLWITFTRSDPATDTYGVGAFTHAKFWGCRGSLIIDARLKSFQPRALETDPEVEQKIDALAVRGGPLAGIIE